MKKFNSESEKIAEIAKIFDSIKSESSRNVKKKILIDNKNNKLFIDILYFIYNPYIITGISDKKLNKKIIHTIDQVRYFTNITNIYDLMDYLKENNTGSGKDIIKLQDYLENSENYKFLRALITKNLKIGIDAKTINDVFGGDFIPTFGIMLAKNFRDHKEKIKNRSFTLTEKLNGVRCILIKIGNKVKFFTRQGHEINGLVEIESESNGLKDYQVYDGEMISINNENLNSEDLFRKTDSAITKYGIKLDLIFNIFDQVPSSNFYTGNCKINYQDRKINFQNTRHIKKVPALYSGYDQDKIEELLNIAVKEDKEGLMLNFNDANYEFKRTDAILKVVKYKRADVRVIDVKEGNNKNKNKLGAIVFEFIHKGKSYTGKCGTGFNDEDRINYWENPNLIMEQIVEIDYKGISRNKKDKYSIRNASWLNHIRYDKNKISMY